MDRPSPVTAVSSTTESRMAPTRRAARRRDARRDDASHRGIVRSIDRPLLASFRQHRSQSPEANARPDHGEHLGRVVRDHVVELGGPELRVDLGWVPLVDVTAASYGEQARAVRTGIPDDLDHVGGGPWMEQLDRHGGVPGR